MVIPFFYRKELQVTTTDKTEALYSLDCEIRRYLISLTEANEGIYLEYTTLLSTFICYLRFVSCCQREGIKEMPILLVQV